MTTSGSDGPTVLKIRSLQTDVVQCDGCDTCKAISSQRKGLILILGITFDQVYYVNFITRSFATASGEYPNHSLD